MICGVCGILGRLGYAGYVDMAGCVDMGDMIDGGGGDWDIVDMGYAEIVDMLRGELWVCYMGDMLYMWGNGVCWDMG